MARDRPAPTPEVRSARRYAARWRVAIAILGGILLAIDPSMTPYVTTAALGLAVIFASGVIESLTDNKRWLLFSEPFACLAAVFIVGFGYGEITPITLLWLVAAGVGVMARGGRVGKLGRVLIIATLLSPLVSTGQLNITVENVALAASAISLLLITGRLSLETTELIRRTRHDADHDALTNALNWGAFRRHLDQSGQAASSESPISILLLDLDDFGRINKRSGHSTGDSLLVSVADTIRAAIPQGDGFGRIDGDTFAIVTTRDAEALGREIAWKLTHLDVPANCSGGVAVAPRDGDDAEGLLGAAAVALRIAKQSGKRRIVKYEGGSELGGINGARDALARLLTGDGLSIHVQPIFDLATNKVHAYEALARFNAPGGQGPLHWFTLADELGLRAELELACLEKALALVPDLPAGTRLTINLSAPLVSDPRALDLLDRCGDLNALIVEVTEEVIADLDDEMAAAIAALRKRGAAFAVDDIGAGYSGLSQLAALQPSYLKLDRALITGIDEDPVRTSLVSALTGYATTTNALLVAEGVENEAELEVCRSIGVPLIQGFLLGKPAEPWPGTITPLRSVA